MHLDRALVVAHIVEQTHYGSAGFQPAQRSVFADEERRQMSSVAVGELGGTSVIDTQEKRSVLFRRRALVQLMIKQTQQCRWRNFRTLRPGNHHSAGTGD